MHSLNSGKSKTYLPNMNLAMALYGCQICAVNKNNEKLKALFEKQYY